MHAFGRSIWKKHLGEAFGRSIWEMFTLLKWLFNIVLCLIVPVEFMSKRAYKEAQKLPFRDYKLCFDHQIIKILHNNTVEFLISEYSAQNIYLCNLSSKWKYYTLNLRIYMVQYATIQFHRWKSGNIDVFSFALYWKLLQATSSNKTNFSE